jgi:O-antigen/teichoic acid export membrane protein
MSDPGTPTAGRPGAASGEQEILLASGTLTQQVAQVAALLATFVVITVLARELTLSEFGVYGLLTSMAGYLLLLQNSIAGASLKNMAAAARTGLDGAFSTAAVLYAAAGGATGILVAAVGIGLAQAVDLSDEVRRQAEQGALALGLVTAVGWPLTVFREALRSSQRFTRAAVTEMLAQGLFLLLMGALIAVGADLWILIGASGSIPLMTGSACAVVVRAMRLPYRFRPSTITRTSVREFLSLAGYLGLSEIAALVIYALDRVILGLFRSAATVGLYEGPVRMHNLLRAVNGALGVTALPTAAKYWAEGDRVRMRELLVRGSRYTLALVVPLTVTLMVLAGPILEVWLGDEFRSAQTAMTILVSYWLVNAATGVAGAMLIASGRARQVVRYSWAVALTNLALSLALTPALGLEGVTLGTAIPYFLIFPFTMRLVLTVAPVRLGELAREAFVPAYSLGAILAVALVAARLAMDLDSVAAVLAVCACAVGGYWLAFYAVWLRPGERVLVANVARGLLPFGSRSQLR